MRSLINTTIREILSSVSFFNDLSQQKLRARTAFKVAKILRLLEAEIVNFETAKQAIFNKYGEKDDDGNFINKDNMIVVKPELADDYNREATELLDTKIEIQAEPLTLEELEDTNFAPEDIRNIVNFIKE